MGHFGSIAAHSQNNDTMYGLQPTSLPKPLASVRPDTPGPLTILATWRLTVAGEMKNWWPIGGRLTQIWTNSGHAMDWNLSEDGIGHAAPRKMVSQAKACVIRHVRTRHRVAPNREEVSSMEAKNFEALSRRIGAAGSRRAALLALAGAVLAPLLGGGTG